MTPTIPSMLRDRAPSVLSRCAGGALAACVLACPALAAGIADVAPRGSYIVAEIRDWPGMRVDLEASGAMSLWEDEKIREYLKGLFGAATGGAPGADGIAEFEEDLAKLGIDLEHLPPLGANTGVALFSAPKQGVDGRAVEGAEPEQQFIAIATLDGEAADDGRTLWEIVDEAIERAEDEGDIEVEALDYGDADEVYRIIVRYEAEEWDEEAWEQWDPEAPDADENFPEPKTVEVVDVEYVAHVADHLVYTTSFDALRDAIDRIEGQDRGETIDDVRAFADARDAGPEESHAYIVALPAAFVGEMDMDAIPLPLPGGDADTVRGMLETLGLTEVSALTGFVVTDAPDSVVEAHFSARMKETRGVFSLITGDPIPPAPPSFVGPDAVALGVFRVNFPKVIPLVRTAFASLPDDPMIQGAQMQFEQFAGQIEPLFNALGPEVIQVGTIKRPFAADSAGALYAISTSDANAVRQTLNTLGGMLGLLPRDFAGSQIWESQMVPVCAGLGSGYVFIGEASSVEAAMLAASQPGAPKLADDPRFVAAERALGQGGIAMGWQDTKSSLEYAAWHAEHFEQVVRAQAETYGMPAEQVDEYVEFMLEQTPEAARTPPPVESFTRVLGDTVSVFRVTDEGIEGRVRILRSDR